MNLFLWLLLAHLLYDFHWQGDFVGQMKSKYWFILGVHALTYGLLLYAVYCFFAPAMLWVLIYLVITHFVIDAVKARNLLNEPPEASMTYGLWLDQALHLAVLIPLVWHS